MATESNRTEVAESDRLCYEEIDRAGNAPCWGGRMLTLWRNSLALISGICCLLLIVIIVLDFRTGGLAWAGSIYLISAGTSALLWYVGRYGARQTLFLICISASVSYTAGWLGARLPSADSRTLAPIVLSLPLAVPVSWLLLLAVAKALAPSPRVSQLQRGMSLTEYKTGDRRSRVRSRRREARRAFWLPGLWSASLASAMLLLTAPVQNGFMKLHAVSPSSDAPQLYELAPDRFIYLWMVALLIINLVNYLHDEYFAEAGGHSSASALIPGMLLVTMEALFLTLALRCGLWDAAAANVAIIGALLLWRRRKRL